MASQKTFSQDIAARARKIGWFVTFNKTGQVVITNPDSHKSVTVHGTPSDRNSFKNVLDRLNDIGFSHDEVEFTRLKEEDRKARLKHIKDTNQADLDKSQREADLLSLAAGRSRVDEATILNPYPLPKLIERVLVDPDLAMKILELNTGNRPIRAKEVSLWANTIETGNWHYTHQGIAIDSNGVLQDGQHRLSAIVQTGIPCELQISIGMPPENFSAIDNGLRRTFGDVVARAGFGNRNRVGTAARLIIIYDAYPNRPLTSKVSNSEVHDFITKTFEGDAKNGDIIAAASNKAQLMWRAVRINVSAATAGIYKLYDLVGDDDPQVLAFVDGIINGTELKENDPRYVLGRNVLNGQNRTAWHHFGLFIKAWNKFITGQTIGQLSLRKNEDLASFQIPIDDDEDQAVSE